MLIPHARRRALFVALALTSFSGGCATTLPAPPIQTAPHDAPRTVGAGRTEIEGGVGFVSAVFDGSLPNAQGTVRHGVTESTEITARATAGSFTNTGRIAQDARLGFFSLRLEFAHDLVPDILMAFGGIGGGVTGAGGYVGMDTGLSVGFNNRYFVPFAAVSLNLSTPVTRITLDFTTEDDTVPNLRRAYSSIGYGVSFGFRVPYGGHATGGEHNGAFVLAMDSGQMFGEDPAEPGVMSSIIYGGVYASIAHRFGGPRAQ